MNDTLHLPAHVADAIHALADTREGPFYLYDTPAIRATCARFRSLPWPDTSVHFATMANSHPTFLRIVHEAGLGVFVNSCGHLAAVRAAGFPGTRIVFAASGLDDATLAAIRAADALPMLDSAGQVARWRASFPAAPFGIRCNIGGVVTPRHTHAGYFVGPESRLGLSPADVEALAGAPDVIALHLYAGTDISDLGYFADCYRALAAWAPLFPALTTLDLGGGFALEDESGADFDLDAWGEVAADAMRAASAACGRPLRLAVEPGRILGGRAGYFVCRVTDVKHTGARRFIAVAASAAQFPRPLFYPDVARHPVALLPAAARASGDCHERSEGARMAVGDLLSPSSPASICGCSTYSRDFLARDVPLPTAKPGDLVVLGDAGSYCAAAYTRFLGFPPAEEIFL